MNNFLPNGCNLIEFVNFSVASRGLFVFEHAPVFLERPFREFFREFELPPIPTPPLLLPIPPGIPFELHELDTVLAGTDFC